MLFALLAQLAGSAEAAAPEAALYSSHAYHDVLLSCPERIWPGLSWREQQFLFSDSRADSAWLVGRGSRDPVAIPKDRFLREFYSGGATFDIFRFQGRRTIAVNTEGLRKEEAFRLAVHELFHETGQAGWGQRTIDDRGALFPLLWEPRYLRRRAFDHFKSAFAAIQEKGNPLPALGAARYWLARWKKSFPEELPMETDSLEGTARYAELMAYLLTETGCGANDESFARAFRALAPGEFRLDPGHSLETEGTLLGSLASFLLNERLENWFARMDGFLMTSDLAVADIPPLAQPENQELIAAYRRDTEWRNERIRQLLAPELAKLENPAFVRVSVPASWQKGNLAHEASYVLRRQRDLTVLVLGRRHRFQGEQGEINLPGKTLALQTSHNECGGMFYFFLPKSAVERHGHEFSAQFQGRSLRFHGDAKSILGYTWLCPRE
ncbi:MAG TPA: hypothetical protein VIH99_10555 [Bdellovibrionota bacterium]|jgi:hypothetical protein